MERPNQPGSGDVEIPLPPLGNGQWGMRAKPPMAATPLADLQGNADILLAVLNFYASRRVGVGATAAILYFPPGRYMIGRPFPPLPDNQTELLCDFVVPSNVTLRFAVGATLVLENYERLFDEGDLFMPSVRARRRKAILGRPEDVFKVRMEIQGTVEAGIQTIFDCVTTDLRDPSTHLDVLGEQNAAGHVYFTRNNVAREVLPEWFGATSSDAVGARGAPPVAFVRRTTMALQEAIRVAHGRRKTLAYQDTAGGQKGVAGKYKEVFPDPLPPGEPAARELPAIALDGGNILVDGTLRRVGAATRHNGRWDFVADYNHRSAIPITLTGSYMVDTELSVGFTLDEAAGYDPTVGSSFPDPFHQPNTFGAVLRGFRGPGRQGAGSVTLRAAPGFATRPPVDHVLPAGQRALLDSASLLAVRGAFGTSVEDISFDGDLRAPRCVTLQVSGGGQAHSLRLAGCALRAGTRELLHMGGDFPNNTGLVKELYNGNLHWSGNHDLLNTQVVRCVFDTATAEELRARGVSRAPVGVMYRTGQSLSVEFSRCVFQGVAAPMFHAWSLRFTLRECVFETKHAGDPLAPNAGTDVFFDNPRNEGQDVQNSAGILPAAAMIKNVTSRSPRFITSFQDAQRSSPPLSAVQLINVVHTPTLADNEPLLPAILWAGTARVFGRLVLMGCRFVRPRAIPLPGDQFEPVLADFVTGYNTPLELDGFLRTASEEGSAKGHVVDLGNRVERPGGRADLVASLVSAADAFLRGEELTRRLRITLNLYRLPFVDQYAEVALTDR